MPLLPAAIRLDEGAARSARGPHPAEVRDLLKACECNDFDARRDTAIISLFFETGLRLSELVNLKVVSTEVDGSDLDLDRQLARWEAGQDISIVAMLGP